jgi:dihydrofolate reductase
VAVEDRQRLRRPDQRPPKYVASRTLEDRTWNATVLDGDAAEGVAKLKEQPGENILKFGTGELDRALLEHGLLDELHLWIFPVLAGEGQRLIDGIETTHLTLVETMPLRSGIVVNTYAPKA